jgi:hypothetical protein
MLLSGDAPIPPDDVILIADMSSVHGLERAVIILVPEVNPPPELPPQYRGMLFNPVHNQPMPKHVQEQLDAEVKLIFVNLVQGCR